MTIPRTKLGDRRCSRCPRQSRSPDQRLCHECHAANMRRHRRSRAQVSLTLRNAVVDLDEARCAAERVVAKLDELFGVMEDDLPRLRNPEARQALYRRIRRDVGVVLARLEVVTAAIDDTPVTRARSESRTSRAPSDS